MKLPPAPNREEAEGERKQAEEIERISSGHFAAYECPYCYGVMYMPRVWHATTPATATCIKCGYTYTPPPGIKATY